MIHHILHHPRLTLPQLQTKDSSSSARRDDGIYFPSVFQRGKKLPASLTLAALPVFVAIALSSCNRFDPVEHVFPNSLYLDVSAMEETHPSNFNSRTQTASQELAVVMSYPADSDVTATVTVDGSLVDTYNHRYGTDYELMPSQYLDFSGQTVTIEAGRTTSETVTIGFKGLAGEGEEQTGAMEIDKTWLLPVRVTSDDMAVMEGSAVAYYLVKRSSSITVAAQLTDNWINFPLLDEPGDLADVYNDLTAVTYEALIYIDKFDTENSFGTCSSGLGTPTSRGSNSSSTGAATARSSGSYRPSPTRARNWRRGYGTMSPAPTTSRQGQHGSMSTGN